MRQLQDKLTPHVKYICVSAELHRDGQPHRHVFIQLDVPMVFNDSTFFDIKNSTEGGPDYHGNYQAAKSPKEAYNYVRKDGEFIELGETTIKKKLSAREKNELILTQNLEDLVEDGTISIYSYRNLLISRNMFLMSRAACKERQKPTVRWLWGPTGSGKTRYAVEHADENYWISSDCQWFDGYNGQTTAILDDLRASTYKFEFLLRLLDRYPVFVQVKGGFAVWKPEVIFITAPVRPEQVFVNHETGETWDRIDQLLRRIDEILEFPREATQPTQDWQEIPEGDDGMGEYYTMKTNWISQ
jgi:hypothetical protein